MGEVEEEYSKKERGGMHPCRPVFPPFNTKQNLVFRIQRGVIMLRLILRQGQQRKPYPLCLNEMIKGIVRLTTN